MKGAVGVDRYLEARQRSGHLTSPESVRTYRFFLDKLVADTNNRDPAKLGPSDFEATLARWDNPNTIAQGRTVFNGYCKWLVLKGIMSRNPIDRVEAPRTRRRRKPRLTRAEVRAMMDACKDARERRAIYLTGCSGLRNAEIRHARGRHFSRPGFIWVSSDIAKGGHERWLPVSPDLREVVDDIIANVALDDLVIPSLRSFNPGVNSDMRPVANALSADGLIALIAKIAERAGIDRRVTPHQLRHYFGEVVTAEAGIHNARALLGHQSIQTTQIYAGEPSLDDLTTAISSIQFRLPAQMMAVRPAVARVPIISSSRELDLPQAFGRVLVDLRRGLRPLLFGLGGTHE